MIFFIYVKTTGEVISKVETTDETLSISDETLAGVEVSSYEYDSTLSLESFMIKEHELYIKQGDSLEKVNSL